MKRKQKFYFLSKNLTLIAIKSSGIDPEKNIKIFRSFLMITNELRDYAMLPEFFFCIERRLIFFCKQWCHQTRVVSERERCKLRRKNIYCLTFFLATLNGIIYMWIISWEILKEIIDIEIILFCLKNWFTPFSIWDHLMSTAVE